MIIGVDEESGDKDLAIGTDVIAIAIEKAMRLVEIGSGTEDAATNLAAETTIMTLKVMPTARGGEIAVDDETVGDETAEMKRRCRGIETAGDHGGNL